MQYFRRKESWPNSDKNVQWPNSDKNVQWNSIYCLLVIYCQWLRPVTTCVCKPESEWELSEFPLRLDYSRSPHVYVNQRLQIQLELLMMSGVPLETCWAFNERWNNKFCYKVASCWLLLLNHTTMHGSMNIKNDIFLISLILNNSVNMLVLIMMCSLSYFFLNYWIGPHLIWVPLPRRNEE